MTAKTSDRTTTQSLLYWGIWISVVIACMTLVGLFGRRVTEQFDYRTLLFALRHIRREPMLWSIAATGASFLALIGRDACGLAILGKKVPRRAVFLAGFCGSALGNAVGFGTLTGGAVRYRIYAAAGLKPDAVAQLMIFLAGSFGITVALVGPLCLIVQAPLIAGFAGWSVPLLRGGAVALLLVVAGALALSHGREIKLPGLAMCLPPLKLGLIQLALTTLDLVTASATLFVLLPAGSVDFGSFTTIYIAAIAAGVIVHLPGGIGVFEAVILFSLRGQIPGDILAAALLMYRGIYFILPLLFSGLLLAYFELRGFAERGQNMLAFRLTRSAARLTPTFLGVITFGAGGMLIVSGATPAFGHRLAILAVRLPLWVVEASHFLGSLAGVLLLFVARGLFHRLDGAWWLALGLSIASLALSLGKGLAYGEASVLAFLIILLLASRPQFGRRASLLAQPFTPSWFAAIALILGSTVWILFFSFDDVRYTKDLWWQFEFDAEAPRALRATLGVCVLGFIVGVFELLRPPRGVIQLPSTDDMQRAAAIIRTQDRSEANLALMGDKTLLFSSSGLAFLMFARRGRSWIALFDPIGPRTEWAELIWRFVDLADSHGGRAAFYQVRPDSLPLYLDAGLKIMKLGEEARIPLTNFSLEGGNRSHLRYALKRGEREGLTFEFHAPERIGALWHTIRDISNKWLDAHHAGEKGFSVAALDPIFMRDQAVGLVKQGDRPIAFASVMTSGQKWDATIGLMRHVQDSSPYAMEYLFTRLTLELKAQGYQVLSMGMAPLSGFAPAPLSSRWHRIGAMIWRYGNTLYNFQGLRLFKGKFSPIWEPRYLAASGSIGPFVALVDAAALIGSTPQRDS